MLFRSKMTRAQKIKYAITHAGMKGHSSAEKIWDYNYNVTTPISGALYTAAGALGGSAEDIAKTFSKLKQRKRRKKINERSHQGSKKGFRFSIRIKDAL